MRYSIFKKKKTSKTRYLGLHFSYVAFILRIPCRKAYIKCELVEFQISTFKFAAPSISDFHAFFFASPFLNYERENIF